MKEITIGISGINAIDNPGPGVGVARALRDDKDLNVRIVGLAYDAMEPGIYLDWLMDRAFMMPYPSGGHDAYLQRLEYIKDSYGLDFVIPCLDVELPFYTKYSKELENMGIKCAVPTMDQFKMRGKDCLDEVAKRIGVEIPKTRVINSLSELLTAVDEMGLPMMIKGAFYKAYYAATTQQAIGFFNSIVAEWGYPIIVQQVVCGDELNVVGMGDGEGECLGLVGIKKLTVTSLGKIWNGVTIKNERMLKAAEEFVQKYKWKGPFELECIVDDDHVYLIEINPRFPAWSYFSAGVGVNLAANMVRSGMGLPVEKKKDYDSGKLYVRYTYEVVTDMLPFQSMMTRGELSNEKAI